MSDKRTLDKWSDQELSDLIDRLESRLAYNGRRGIYVPKTAYTCSINIFRALSQAGKIYRVLGEKKPAYAYDGHFGSMETRCREAAQLKRKAGGTWPGLFRGLGKLAVCGLLVFLLVRIPALHEFLRQGRRLFIAAAVFYIVSLAAFHLVESERKSVIRILLWCTHAASLIFLADPFVPCCYAALVCVLFFVDRLHLLRDLFGNLGVLLAPRNRRYWAAYRAACEPLYQELNAIREQLYALQKTLGESPDAQQIVTEVDGDTAPPLADVQTRLSMLSKYYMTYFSIIEGNN